MGCYGICNRAKVTTFHCCSSNSLITIFSSLLKLIKICIIRIYDFISRVYVEQSSDGRGLDLIFRSLEKSDEGEYACTATLDGRKEHRNVSLGIIGTNMNFDRLTYYQSNFISSSLEKHFITESILTFQSQYHFPKLREFNQHRLAIKIKLCYVELLVILSQ